MKSVLDLKNISLSFGRKKVLKQICLSIEKNQIIALIGPSGCGKSTLLKCINRMHDHNPDAELEGELFFNGKNVYDKNINVHHIRRDIGMVFQKPNPFPKSIEENIAFGLKINGIRSRKNIREIIEKSLKEAFLWDEVKDKLNESALSLSGGQQQRLCIARCIAIKPKVILMDEPTSALDPLATEKIEHLIRRLKKDYTIVIVTHNMQQAQRISDKVAMLYLGDLIEYRSSQAFFDHPEHKLAQQYVKGAFG
jgi:phosphate transport system ATP-binding protein